MKSESLFSRFICFSCGKPCLETEAFCKKCAIEFGVYEKPGAKQKNDLRE